MNNHELLSSIIEKLISKGGYENFAIINLSNGYYVQLSAEIGDTKVYCEAVSDNYLKYGNKLPPTQIEALKVLKWEDPASPQDNYSTVFSVNSAAEKLELVNHLMRTVTSVYNTPMISERSVELNLD